MIAPMLLASRSSAPGPNVDACDGRRLRLLAALVVVVVAGCASPPLPAPVAPPAVAPAPTRVEVAPPASEAPAPGVPAATQPVLPSATAPKETPLVELPSYARRGKRLPADGGEPGRAVIAFCRSAEVEKDAATYFKRLQRQNRLPTATEIVERNRQTEQSLTMQQYVERDWALRRENNKTAPQKCKVLGGSIDSATAHVVFEADLNGRRQRGTAAVVLTAGTWRMRDHGDWSPVR